MDIIYNMDEPDKALSAAEFEWDRGNIEKNWERHRVAYVECEEVLLSGQFIITKDTAHSIAEDRYRVLGKTDEGRILFLAFTLRGGKIRVITARDANKKERKTYEEAEKSANL
ncbi:MAG: BrnT family toxin [Syntrophorhabdales bacterium]|jgi:hypothetical protein